MQWFVRICLLVFSFTELFIIPTFVVKRKKTALKSAISSFVFIWLIFIVDYSIDLNIPDIVFIFVIISLFADSYFGYYLNLYNKSKKFDRIQHVLGSFSFAIFFYFLFSNIFEYGGSKAFKAFYILLLGIFSGLLYEIIEFISDLKHHEKMQRGLRDTNFDMVSDVIGSVSASVLSYFILL